MTNLPFKSQEIDYATRHLDIISFNKIRSSTQTARVRGSENSTSFSK